MRYKKLFVIWIAMFAIITYITAGFPSTHIKKDIDKPTLTIAISKELDDEKMLAFQNAFKDEIKFIPIDNSEYQAKEAVFLNGVDLALIKDKKNAKTLVYSNPADIDTYKAKETLKSFMNIINLTETKKANGIEIASELAKISLKPQRIKTDNMPNYTQRWYSFAFRFLAYLLMSVIMSIIGLGIISFQTKENQDRIKISAMPMLKLKLSSFFAQFIATIIIISLAIFILFLMGGKSDIKYLAYFSNIFALGMSSLGLIFLLSHINHNKDFISAVGNIPLFLAFISGVFVDVSLLPDLALNIARFFPPFYYIKGNELAQHGFSKELFFYIGIQLLFATCYFLLAVFIDKLKMKAKLS